MIRPSTRFALLIALFLVFATPLHADDGEREQSEAAKRFREAWWAETSRGALDEAVAGYAEAAAAKGSDRIRARALYRRALVLQRMGKTEEAVRGLERLASTFPRESTLLAQARKRLDEWTAEDLRTSFSDWYQRYKYSAAFQAKIVDLVLKLGGADQDAANAARQELLTIGEPALNALREHTDSPSAHLRVAAIELLLEIGSLPPPDVLWKGGQWHRKRAFWTLLAEAPEAQRAAFAQAAAAKPDDFRAAWVSAALRGPEAVLEAVAAETNDVQSVTNALVAPLLARKPGAGFYAGLRAVVRDPDVHFAIRQAIASRLLWTWANAHTHESTDPTGLTAQEVTGWLAHKVLHGTVLPHLRASGRAAPDAWRRLATLAMAKDASTTERRDLLTAMLGQLRLVPVETDTAIAERALAAFLATQALNTITTSQLREGAPYKGSSAVPWRVLVAAITQARGSAVRSAPSGWWNWMREREGALEPLFVWMREGATVALRQEAMRTAAQEIRDRPARLTAALGDATQRETLREPLFRSLVRNPMLEDLAWEKESLTRLVEAARAGLRAGSGWSTFSMPIQGRSIQLKTRFAHFDARVLARLLHAPRTGPLFFEAALEAPERFTPALWDLLGSSWSADAANRARMLKQLRARWLDGSTDQRAQRLRLFVVKQLFGTGTEELTAFLRTVLEQGGDLDDETRFFVVGRMGTLTLDDLRSIYAFEDPAQRSQAERLMGRVPKITLADVESMYDLEDPEDVDLATQHLHRLPVTEEVYDAFRLALRPQGKATVLMYERFKELESRAPDLMQRMLVHESKSLHGRLKLLLQNRDTVEDLPIWMALLEHESAWLRTEAAKALGRMYDDAAIKALARAVDDPDPNVRDAVLASLERIEKTEKQKERWRKFAEGK